MNYKRVYSILNKDLKIIENELERVLESGSPILQESSLHYLQAGGKRIRPILVILSAKFGDYTIDTVKDVAVALELIHMASLIHDDVIDDAYTRTKNLLLEKKGEVEKLAEELLTKEVLFQSDVEALIGPRPYEEKKPLSVEDDHHHDGGISEGVPPYDPNVTNQQPAAK